MRDLSRDSSRLRPTLGFTLLEVMVSLAILALALTAIAGINANSFDESNYARFATVATLLARSKMIDVEEELRKDGFGDSDKELSGDFDAEGYPSMKWVATCRQVELNVSQLVGGLLGGEVSSESLPEQVQSLLGSTGGAGSGLAGLIPAGGAQKGGQGTGGTSDLSKLLGEGGLEVLFKQVGDTLSKSIREITLEITWGKKGHDLETVKFVQYVVTTGRLAAPQGGQAALPLDAQAGGVPGVPAAGVPGLPGSGIAGVPGLPRPGDRNPNTLQATSPFGAPAAGALPSSGAGGKGGRK